MYQSRAVPSSEEILELVSWDVCSSLVHNSFTSLFLNFFALAEVTRMRKVAAVMSTLSTYAWPVFNCLRK